VFRFYVYVEISFGSVIASCVCPLLCGCCENDDLVGFVLFNPCQRHAGDCWNFSCRVIVASDDISPVG
jgi:hypothetical protein